MKPRHLFIRIISVFMFIAGTYSSVWGQGGWTDDGTVVRLTTSTDNVGIGTTSPGTKLDVNGSLKASNIFINSTVNTGYKLRVSSTNTGGGFSSILVEEGTAATGSFPGTYGISVSHSGGANAAGVYAVGVWGRSSGAEAYGGQNIAGYWDAGNNTENIGGWFQAGPKLITSTVPSYTVENVGGYFAAGGKNGATPTNTNIGIEIDNVGGGGTNYGIEIKAPSSGSNNYAIYSSATAKSYFAGPVGIGTTTLDTFELAVCGQIRAKALTVETGWCDFVFDENYVLMPLEDVDTYIQAKKHLPGIPPARMVEAKGLNVGEMQMRMMQKIEELTLYLVEQHKVIGRLERENERINSILTAMNK